MKSIKVVAGMIVLAALSVWTMAQAPVASGKHVNNAETIVMTSNTYAVVLAQTVQPVSPMSISLTFKSPVTNEFTFSFVRGGYTNNIIDRYLTNWSSYVWFSPRDLQLVTDDRLQFTKTTNATAQLTISWK